MKMTILGAILQGNKINSAGINLKIKFVSWVLKFSSNVETSKFTIWQIQLFGFQTFHFDIYDTDHIFEIKNQNNCEIYLKGQILEPLKTLQVQML